MQSSRYSIYLAHSESMYKLGLARDVGLELSYLHACMGYDTLVQLSFPLNLRLADFILHRISSSEERIGKVLSPGKRALHNLVNQRFCSVKKHLFQWGCYSSFSMQELAISRILGSLRMPPLDSLGNVSQMLKGKILFESEIESIVPGHALSVPLRNILDILVLKGEGKRFPGVGMEEFFSFRCNRCGETSEIFEMECSFCGETDVLCRSCISMGMSAGCRALYAFSDDGVLEKNKGERVKARLDFPLTQAQERASEYLREFVRIPHREECLVWAVCGAGKTEVAFAAIEEELSSGGRVLFAVPRRNVVMELEPRFRGAFPDVGIIPLYGGSPQKPGRKDITIATTHQVMRLFETFDLVILDEADAYPYAGSSMLYLGIQRSRKSVSKLVYMTATPRGLSYQDFKYIIRIPARHHGYPVPIPEFLKVHFKTGQTIPREVMSFLQKSVVSKYQVFFFVPTIELCERVGRALLTYFTRGPGRGNGIRVAYSHSQDRLRDKKCDDFVSGRINVFVTTSIMERGITVPAANVVVMFADNEKIYDQSSLIQMAGRAGRTTQYPIGHVLFVAEECTPVMKQAIKVLIGMNNEAKRLGYLKEGACQVVFHEKWV